MTSVHPAQSPDTVLREARQCLENLRRQGIPLHWQVDFDYAHALLNRMVQQSPRVRQLLEPKLTGLLESLNAQAKRLQHDDPRADSVNQNLSVSPLGQLVQWMEARAPESGIGASAWAEVSRTDWKPVPGARGTWSTLSAQKQVTQALARAPRNAGPINSHMLVLRALELMQDSAPDYLHRFMSYADTLVWLDHTELGTKPGPARPPVSAKAKPRSATKPSTRSSR